MTRVDFEVPRDAERAPCRGCTAEVWWIVTESGRRMPLEVATAETDEDGKVRAESHFARCPDANRFRRRRG